MGFVGFLIIIGVVLLILLAPILDLHATEHWLKKRKKYSLFSQGFKVNEEEYKQIPPLRKSILVGNKYCQDQILILYLTIQREFPKEIKSFSDSILVLCKCAVLRELNYEVIDIINREDCVKQLANTKISQTIDERACTVLQKITGTEDRKFYVKNADAWEIRYHHLKQTFTPAHIQSFYEDICELATKNNKKITIERRIYLNAYLSLVNIDREYALRFYLHYLSVRGLSGTFQYRKIVAKYRKILFRNADEEQTFDTICSKLLQYHNWEKAIEEFEEMRISQRKKIKLDIQAIKSAAEKQSKVAGVLGDLLKDEEEQSIAITEKEEKPVEEVAPEPSINHKDALFQLFINSSFKLNKEEVNIFARPRGIFVGQFMESINEEYYEELDDVLIEEDDDYYVINEAYFQQIKENGNERKA